MNNKPKSGKSDLILEELKKRGSESPLPTGEKLKIVVFTLAGNRYAFKGENIKEILPFSKISFVPGCPDFILGIINVRGDIESVVGIDYILRLSRSASTGKTRIIIAESNNIRTGILVDSVEDVIDIEQKSIHSAASNIAEGVEDYVVGEVELPKYCITMLDIDNIFSKIAPPRQRGR